MEVHGLVVWWDDRFGHHRIWRIKSICLGAVGVESLAELESMTEKPGTDTEGVLHATTWIPTQFLYGMAVYRRTDVLVQE